MSDSSASVRNSPAWTSAGQRPLMWNFDSFGAESERSHKSVPFYLSNRGYGVAGRQRPAGRVRRLPVHPQLRADPGARRPDRLLRHRRPDPAQVLDRYNRLTCRPSAPPKWAFGTWISSGFYADSQEQVLARARRIRELGIPCDVLHLDCYWQRVNHWSDLQWDTEQFLDPAGMLATLAEQGFKVCLWINPYLSHLLPCFRDRRGSRLSAASPRWLTVRGRRVARLPPRLRHRRLHQPEGWEWFAGSLRRLLSRGWRSSRPTSPKGCRSTRWPTTA